MGRKFIGMDNRGCEPKEGDYVAYNYSGQVATGHIVRIASRSRIIIRQSYPKDGHESILKGGPQCLMVLSPSQR